MTRWVKKTYRWGLSILECIDDAVNLQLAVDVLLLLLDVDWLVDVCHGERRRVAILRAVLTCIADRSRKE